MKRKYVPLTLFVVSMLLFAFYSCNNVENQEQEVFKPLEVVTIPVSDIEYQSATCGGLLSGGAGNIIYGVCWGLTPTPTISESLSEFKIRTDSFTCRMNGLKPDETYYVRAYATQGAQTIYGSTKSFKTKKTFINVVTTPLNVTNSYALVGCSFFADHGDVVLNKGFCWSFLPYPIINDSWVTTSNDTTSTLIAVIMDLDPNTLYYFRAYASSSSATIYGENIAIKTRKTYLYVSTLGVKTITNTTALCSVGNISSDQPSSITARGVCWSKTNYPTISDSKTTDGVGISDFLSTLTGLSSGTTYYVRAYVTDAESTVYGSPRSFKTLGDIIPAGVPEYTH